MRYFVVLTICRDECAFVKIHLVVDSEPLDILGVGVVLTVSLKQLDAGAEVATEVVLVNLISSPRSFHHLLHRQFLINLRHIFDLTLIVLSIISKSVLLGVPG